MNQRPRYSAKFMLNVPLVIGHLYVASISLSELPFITHRRAAAHPSEFSPLVRSANPQIQTTKGTVDVTTDKCMLQREMVRKTPLKRNESKREREREFLSRNDISGAALDCS